MFAKINTTPKLYSPEKAEEVAKMMTALEADDEDGWTYKAKHDPKGTGYSLVSVYDENGEFVDYLF